MQRTTPGFAALKAAAKNPYSRFTFAENDSFSAGWRMSQRAPVDVHVAPKFRLSPADAIFTMGSCFARNVEANLVKLGAHVLLKDFDFPMHLFDQGHSKFESLINSPRRSNLVRSVLNKYTPLSMLNEFERILAPEKFRDPFKGLIQVDVDKWADPHIKNTRMLSLNDALLARAHIENATAKVTEATAVFLTLGFTETWLDSETGIVMNQAPKPVLIKKWPERFRFFNATHAEVLQSLEEMYCLITQRVRPDMKFIVTVSPVPLGTTFTEKDVISANTYSKSTLRSAVGEFCMRYANVDYYPSYEMVINTHPDVAWQEDWIHPTLSTVESVIERFVQNYYVAASQEAGATVG